jgi:hypothetical protein
MSIENSVAGLAPETVYAQALLNLHAQLVASEDTHA